MVHHRGNKQAAQGNLRRCQDEESLEDKDWRLYVEVVKGLTKKKNL